MTRMILTVALSCLAAAPIGSTKANDSADANHPTEVIVVVGAAGTDEYGKAFQQWANNWKLACEKGEAEFKLIDRPSADTDQRSMLVTALTKHSIESDTPLWIVLIGHGTFDGKSAKFNLVGPDLTAKELSKTLDSCKRPTAVACCFSSSAPFINRLSAPNRILLSATKSGAEHHYSRFGQFLSETVLANAADLDKDGQTSILEAFLIASRKTEAWYQGEGRLASEHALLDDNGDQKGTPTSWFQGFRAIRSAKNAQASDGVQANTIHLIPDPDEVKLTPEQQRRRDDLESQLEQLRARKKDMPEVDYYRQLEAIALELARMYSSDDQQDEDQQND